MTALIITFALSYLLGSIPFGLVLTRLAGLGDIRSIGSGNIGATNVLRTGRKDLAAATLILDSGKGAAAVFIAYWLGLRPEVAAAGAFFGHCFPVWLNFKGGKGVATFLGTVLALWLPAGLMACATWLAVVFITRISSLGALSAAAATPLFLFSMGKASFSIAGFFLAVLIFIRHHENIVRLLRGNEPKIGDKSKNADATAAASTASTANTAKADANPNDTAPNDVTPQ